jgi:lipopolysaccharide biosynthesis glycosyltransferase
MHPSDFNEQNKEKIKSFERKYNRIEINLIDMKEVYKNAFKSRHITTPTYYRLSLSELLPNIDKILWIDGDTITFNDLKEMYDIDMKNFHYKGLLDISPNAVDFFTTENDHYICSGVMIINLKELRKDNMVSEFISFISKFQEELSYHDQTVINVLSYKKIDILPPKFGIFNIKKLSNWNKHISRFRYKYKYSKEELYEAYYYPVILHCIYKPWFKKKIIILILGWIIIILSGGIMQKKRISIMKFFQNIYKKN